MKEALFPFWAYLIHWLKKEDQYSQHSPFVFEIYSDLIQFLYESKSGIPLIESFRKELLKDQSVLSVTDFGAGSKKVPTSSRKVSDITRYSTSGSKFCLVYQYFCSLTQANHVIELGTCMGISTRYLDLAVKGRLYSFEGSSTIQEIAKREPRPQNTNFILGQIQETLPITLAYLPSVDFALIDANHTYQGTISSFNSILEKVHPKSILIISDIYWNKGMEKAWEEIKSNQKVKLTLDFYECGVVFFDFTGPKTNLILAI